MNEFESFLQAHDDALRMHLIASVEPPFYGRLMQAIAQFAAPSRSGTDSEQYVRTIWPDAYVWGRMKNGRRDPTGNFVIIRAPHWSGLDGSGATEDEAWDDTAKRLRHLMRGTEGR